ncbi:hypothetical protein BGW42_001257 [Actinomortierella wolfii]|nr:hypothetical protein BGW42_001257 [Actinomortierella wolfii]
MKFTPLLISAALAIVATAAPLSNVNVDAHADISAHPITKRCNECTQTDGIALDLIVKSTADHFAEIAVKRLDSLNAEIQTAKVTSNNVELPQEKTALTVTVQAKIDAAKKACSPEELAPVIKATVATDGSLDIPWSQKSKDEVEQKLVELNVKVTKLVVDRIQANINADVLSKECTENMTNTKIEPAPEDTPFKEDSAPEEAAPSKDTSAPSQDNSAPSQDTSASEPAADPATDAPADSTSQESVPATDGSATYQQPSEESKPDLKAGIDVAADVDSKYVCKSGCVDSEDAKHVLALRVNLEGVLAPRIDHFVQKEIPSDCNEKRNGLLDAVLNLLDGLKVNADVKN